jgi:hypothetical protein
MIAARGSFQKMIALLIRMLALLIGFIIGAGSLSLSSRPAGWSLFAWITIVQSLLVGLGLEKQRPMQTLRFYQIIARAGPRTFAPAKSTNRRAPAVLPRSPRSFAPRLRKQFSR